MLPIRDVIALLVIGTFIVLMSLFAISVGGA